ncbi:MAG: hypothetical protein S4CHLAM102_01170 [Chlamydiia bacterium]|nr:hypothetical protein [Chlamydiia bacterium]
MFTHHAIHLEGNWPLVYTAYSKHLFYMREAISAFVVEQGLVPLNPFMIFDYFLQERVKRDSVRQANNSLVTRADQVFVFGPISDGVLSEILLARKLGKPIIYYTKEFEVAKLHEAEMEEEVFAHRHLLIEL